MNLLFASNSFYCKTMALFETGKFGSQTLTCQRFCLPSEFPISEATHSCRLIALCRVVSKIVPDAYQRRRWVNEEHPHSREDSSRRACSWYLKRHAIIFQIIIISVNEEGGKRCSPTAIWRCSGRDSPVMMSIVCTLILEDDNLAALKSRTLHWATDPALMVDLESCTLLVASWSLSILLYHDRLSPLHQCWFTKSQPRWWSSG